MSQGPTWAVLPIKPFDDAKSRLQPVLDAAQRRDLARSLMLHSLSALLASSHLHRVLVVSADSEALALAAEQGAATLHESGEGLNAALEEARLYAVSEGAARLLVLASDLPLLDASDIDALIAAGKKAAVVIAPDRRGEGTNALLLQPTDAVAFGFGELSRQRHLDLAAAARLTSFELKRSGLMFDVDLPQDWRDLRLADPCLERALGSSA